MRKSVVVTILFIAFAGSIFALMLMQGPLKAVGEEDKTKFVAFFDNVALLEKKAKVAVAGNVIGQVLELEQVRRPVVDETGQTKDVPRIRVTFEINSSIADWLGDETLAVVGQESFLGAKYLELKATPEGDALETFEGMKVVRTKKYSDLFTTAAGLTDQLTPLIDSAKALLDNLNNNVLSPANVDQISALLSNANVAVQDADSLVNNVNDQLTGQNGVLENANTPVTDLQGTVDQLERNLQTISDKLVGTLENVDGVLAQANTTLVTVTDDVHTKVVPSATDLMNNANDLVVGLGPKVDGSFKKLDTALDSANDLLNARELYATLYEARRLMQEMQLLVISLRADPSQLVFGGKGAEAEAEKGEDGLGQRTGGRGAPYED